MPSQTFTPTSAELLLPRGTRLLHIGPFKTGTSALQGAFCQARDELEKHGVAYPAGALRHWRNPTLALTRRRNVRGRPVPEPRHWQQLVDAFDEAGDRTVLHSSEAFTECHDDDIRRTVRELGGSHPMHIAITLRPLAKILPSQWQMHVQGGRTPTPYDEWLRQVFDDAPIEPGDPTERFWYRHDHARLAARWAEVLGPDNVTVIVADPNDKRALLKPFETMLGLPSGVLAFEPGHANESLPPSVLELLRRINRVFDERSWDETDYFRLVRSGGTARVRATVGPRRCDPPIHTPAWARQRATEIGNRIVEDLGDLGIRVAGDLDHLLSFHDQPPSPEGLRRPGDHAGDRDEPAAGSPDGEDSVVTVTAAAGFTVGIIARQQGRAAKLRESLEQARENTARAKQELAHARRIQGPEKGGVKRETTAPQRIEHRRVADVDARTLIRLLVRRGVRRIHSISERSRDT